MINTADRHSEVRLSSGVVALWSIALTVLASSGCVGSEPVGGAGGRGGASSAGQGGSGTGGAKGGAAGGGDPSGGAGSAGSGGVSGSGGATNGSPETGGRGGGGSAGLGGSGGSGGSGGVGGRGGTGGGGGTGGSGGTGGASGACMPGPPLTGDTQHCSSNASGKIGSYTWTIWSSGTGGCLTTYSNAGAAFSATWNNAGDFLARVGLQMDRTKTYDQYGTISAEFAETHTGSAGGYSYIGIYGWSVQPTHEYYIVEDSFNGLPFNPGGTKVGTVSVDGGTYDIISRNATGASIDGSSSWVQFYSIRQKPRSCGHISITEHFKAWTAAGLTLGKMEEAKILIEAGGGSGSINFTTGTVTAQ